MAVLVETGRRADKGQQDTAQRWRQPGEELAARKQGRVGQRRGEDSLLKFRARRPEFPMSQLVLPVIQRIHNGGP